MTKISVIGLGKLGQPFAACLASRGFEVLGIDKDRSVVLSLGCEWRTVQEPGLQELLEEHPLRLSFTTELARAIIETDTTFILVGTPSNADGSFSPDNIVAVLDELGAALAESGKPQHTFVIGSTVSPGAAAESLIPALVRHVGRERFRYAYCPELVALGNVVEGFLRPDFVVIGTDDTAWPVVRDVYDRMTPGVEIVRLSVAEAEIFKVALNFFLTLKISFANTVALICEQFPGADVDRVTGALGLDSRISPKFLRGGMPFGGFCFPRDVAAFAEVSGKTRHGVNLPAAIQNASKIQALDVYAKIVGLGTGSVSVLGLAFKPGTLEIEKSPSIDIAERLLRAGKSIIIHDPLAMDKARAVLGDDVEYAASARECARASTVAVLATAWPEYAELDESDFQEGATVIDCWRMLKSKLKDSERVRYIGIGMGQ